MTNTGRIERNLRFIVRAVSGVPGCTEAQMGRLFAEIEIAAKEALSDLQAVDSKPADGAKDCPSCRDSDSWGLADKPSCVGCFATPDGKGTLYVPLNGPRR